MLKEQKIRKFVPSSWIGTTGSPYAATKRPFYFLLLASHIGQNCSNVKMTFRFLR